MRRFYEVNALLDEIKDKASLLDIVEVIKKNGVPPINVEKTPDGVKLSQDGITGGIVLRVPEGLELLKMKIEKEIS